jgi:hypothetical protein
MRITINKVNGTGELHLGIIKTICGEGLENKSLLDLCCCHAPITSQLKFKKRVYVDILPRILDEPSEREFFVQYNSLDFLNDKGGYYDVITCLDGIEHLSKENGYYLTVQTTLFSEKQIFFTPLGDYLVDTETLNPEAHKSGWMPEDFEQLGWATIVLPNYHPLLGIGAFYAWNCNKMESEFERIKNELHNFVML